MDIQPEENLQDFEKSEILNLKKIQKLENLESENLKDYTAIVNRIQ